MAGKTTVRRRSDTTEKQVVELHARSDSDGGLKGRATNPGAATRLCGLLFGPPKTSKTTIATSLPNTLLIQFDPDGDQTETIQGRDDIYVLKPRSWNEMDDIVKQLHGPDRDTFNCVTLDSLTFMPQILSGKQLWQVLKDNRDPRRTYMQAGAGISQTVHDLVALPGHVMFTAHLKIEGQEDDSTPLDPTVGEHQWALTVSPMVWKTIGPAVSFIGRTYRKVGYAPAKKGEKRNKETQFWVSFNDDGRSPAGSRIALPAEVQDLDLNKLVANLEGGA